MHHNSINLGKMLISIVVYFNYTCMYDYTQEHNRTGGVMVSVLAVSAVERGFEPR